MFHRVSSHLVEKHAARWGRVMEAVGDPNFVLEERN